MENREKISLTMHSFDYFSIAKNNKYFSFFEKMLESGDYHECSKHPLFGEQGYLSFSVNNQKGKDLIEYEKTGVATKELID